MVFFSNGGNESSSSSGHISACDSDSDEKRFYKETNNSQSQRSSSTSASSSDSEPEQVSIHPAVEKLTAKKPGATPSKKKHEGTPSELSSKAPSTTKRQRSSSTSTSSSDSEPEQLSSSLAAEKPDAVPSSKKKPRKQKQESAATVAMPEVPGSSTPMRNAKSVDGLVYEIIMKEVRGVMAEFTRDVKNMIDNFNAEMRVLLSSYLRSANNTRGAGG